MTRRLRITDILFTIITFATIEIFAFFINIKTSDITNIFLGYINVNKFILIILYYLISLFLVVLLSQYNLVKEKKNFIKNLASKFILLIKFSLPLVILYTIINYFSFKLFLIFVSDDISAFIYQFLIDWIKILIIFLFFFFIFYIPLKKENNLTIRSYFKINKNIGIILIFVLFIISLEIFHLYLQKELADAFYSSKSASWLLSIIPVYDKTAVFFYAVYHFVINVFLFLVHIIFNIRRNEEE